MTNDEKKAWENHKKEMENMRRRRRNQFYLVVREFRDLGFEVKEVNKYQFRFNEMIDIFPSNKKFHNLETGERGDIRGQTFTNFLKKYFNL